MNSKEPSSSSSNTLLTDLNTKLGKMIAHRNQFSRATKEQCSRGGKRSQQVQADKRMSCPAGPRPTPPGKLLRTFMNANHQTGQFIRYDIYKSYYGKRKVDIMIDRTRTIKGKSITWLMTRLREKMCIMPEIVED